MTYHSPTPDMVPKFAAVQKATIALGQAILDNCPQCADRSTAMRKLREARMDANAAIALNGLI
jgi:hypothetical protein